jgi:hypothetical protein
MKARGGLSLNLLRISIAVFFVLLGFYGILPTLDESVFSLIPGQGWGPLEVVFGCVELVCGVLIILSLFTFMPKKTKVIVSLIIFITWCARVIISKLVFSFVNGWFFQSFAVWLLVLSAELVIAAALWIFYRNSDL